jgi:hypothetical protein
VRMPCSSVSREMVLPSTHGPQPPATQPVRLQLPLGACVVDGGLDCQCGLGQEANGLLEGSYDQIRGRRRQSTLLTCSRATVPVSAGSPSRLSYAQPFSVLNCPRSEIDYQPAHLVASPARRARHGGAVYAARAIHRRRHPRGRTGASRTVVRAPDRRPALADEQRGSTLATLRDGSANSLTRPYLTHPGQAG